MFNVKKELLETQEVLLTIEVSEKKTSKAMRAEVREISREYRFPGFRKGRVPYRVVVNRFGEEAILHRVSDQIIKDIYPKIIEEAAIDPYGPGELEDVEYDPLTYFIRVPLMPDVDLGDYEGIWLNWEEPTISEEEVEARLEEIQEEHMVLEPKDEPAEIGDEVYLDIEGLLPDGEKIIEEEDFELILDPDETFITPGFIEEIVGLAPEDEKSFTLTLPETLAEEALRNAEVTFEVYILDIYKRILPDIDDALAMTVGNYEDLDELKESIHSELLDQKREQGQREYRESLVDLLVEQAEVRYPPAMLEDEIDDLVENTERNVQQQAQISLEDLLNMQGQSMEEFREGMRPQAEARLVRGLVMTKFAQQEGLSVDDDELVREFSETFGQFEDFSQDEMLGAELDSQFARMIRNSLVGKKAMDRLEAIGKGEATFSADAAEEADEAEEGEETTESHAEATLDEDDEDEAPDTSTEA
ncbi:MAG: trigger factor [Chloroflexi bacterium]|nr:trigger factor [Chloroflexota bacterium]